MPVSRIAAGRLPLNCPTLPVPSSSKPMGNFLLHVGPDRLFLLAMVRPPRGHGCAGRLRSVSL